MPNPEAKVSITVDDQNGDFLFDTSASQVVGGQIIDRQLVPVGSGNYNYTRISRDFNLDPEGKIFRVTLPFSDVRLFRLTVSANIEDSISSDLLLIPFRIENPPQNSIALPFENGVFTAVQTHVGGEASAIVFHLRNKLYSPLAPFVLRPDLPPIEPYYGNFPAVAEIRDLTAPRLSATHGVLYLAGRHKSAQTWFYRSYDLGKIWEKIGMIWNSEYFHSDMEMMVGGGACSVAFKRVSMEIVPGQPLMYVLELWFRKTFDLANWEAEPVKIAEKSPVSLELSLLTYAEIMNRALNGGASVLIVKTSSGVFSDIYESQKQGAEGSWRAL